MAVLQRKLAVFALGAIIAVLGSLGFSSPEISERPQTDKARKVKLPQPQAATEGKGCTCEGHGCCSGGGGGGACACCQGRAALDSQPSSLLLVRAEREQKGEQKKGMKMASAEAKAKGMAARKAILTHQAALMDEEVYGCCIKPGCVFCSTAADMCPCAMNLRKGRPVCPECWGGWQAGKGRLSGVKPEDVKVLPKSMMKKMYDMRSKNFEKAEKK